LALAFFERQDELQNRAVERWYENRFRHISHLRFNIITTDAQLQAGW
jgi:hypothetical protein